MVASSKHDRTQRFIAWIAIVGLTIVASVHLGLTWLYNSPDNAVKISYDAPLSHYFGRLLYQNWAFFAPEPIDRDTSLIARARDVEGKQTGWIDVTGPLIADLQRNRFSSYELVAASLMNASLEAHNDVVARRKNRDKSNLMAYYQFRSLYRTGASVLLHLYPNRRFASIQIGFLDSHYPRFTQRHQSNDRALKYLWALDSEAFPSDVDSTGW